MNSKTRKIIVFFLVLVFVTVAPMMLLYASGYRYNWRKHRIEKTGILFIDTNPSEAVILLNGKPQPQTSPASLTRLLPEDYVLSLKKEGYFTWEKKLAVESGRTTFAKGIILLKDELPKQVTQSSVIAGAFSDDGTVVAYLTDDVSWSELKSYDFQSGSTVILARFEKGRLHDTSLSFSADGSTLMMTATDAKGTPMATLYPLGSTLDAKSMTLPIAAIAPKWSSENAEIVANATKEVVYADKTSEKTSAVLLPRATSVTDVFRSGTLLWAIIRNAEGERLVDLGSGNPDTITVNSFLREINLPDDGYRIIGGSDQWLVLANGKPSQGLLLNTGSMSYSSLPDVTDMRWEHPDGTGRLIVWNDFEMYLLDTAKPEPLLLARIGSRIIDCAWHPKSAYVIYSTTSEIVAVDMDGRDRRDMYRLTMSGVVKSMTVDAEAGVLRFVGSIGNQSGVYERGL